MSAGAKITAWRSPSGRLHLRQRCSGNGQSRKTVRVTVTREEYDALLAERKVCRCMIWSQKEVDR